jgi:hypothetical protein
MEKIKNIISILKDGILVLLFILLICFPAFFNGILVRAGFTDGSVMGFNWKKKAIESKQVADSSHIIALDAGNKMDQMQLRLDSISKNLVGITATPNNQAAIERINKVVTFSKNQLKENKMELKNEIQLQDNKLDMIFKDAPLIDHKN